ncbi:serine/threonine-protein kinase pim-2-like [Anneissia japonica]|uniref:serine/threonine-protein kinase pim-2-like n=1 Tax=Anneissia japonica TaxID=1529436 RepID=UPI00142586C0|nr:serine/threonine-protein kinase pim-2-like [Anneissia japonica]
MVIREDHFLELASDIENCIRLLEWKHVGPHHFLVMERPVNCSDLHQVIEEFGILAENRIRRIFRQTVRACIACTEKRFVHGDIKPENILVDLDRWDAKLIDFGFSRYFDDDRPFFYLEGTTDYLPPEWEREGCVRSLPATVWSLGLVLFEMCTFVDVSARKPSDIENVTDDVLRSLLLSILVERWQDRPKLGEVYAHEWLQYKKDETENC